MSWDIYMMSVAPEVKSLDDFDEHPDWILPLGTPAEVVSAIRRVWPDLIGRETSFNGKTHTDYLVEESGYSINFSIDGKDRTVTGLMLFIHGDGDIIAKLQLLCEQTGWRIVAGSDGFMQFTEQTEASFKDWQNFRDRVNAQSSLPHFYLPGEQIHTIEDFYRIIGEVINGPGGYFGTNLDALNDCLYGHFGTGPRPYVIRWNNHIMSKHNLGYPETIRQLEIRAARPYPSNRPLALEKLALAKKHEGPTVFDWLVEVMTGVPEVYLELA